MKIAVLCVPRAVLSQQHARNNHAKLGEPLLSILLTCQCAPCKDKARIASKVSTVCPNVSSINTWQQRHQRKTYPGHSLRVYSTRSFKHHQKSTVIVHTVWKTHRPQVFVLTCRNLSHSETPFEPLGVSASNQQKQAIQWQYGQYILIYIYIWMTVC